MTKPAHEIELNDIDLDFIERTSDAKALRQIVFLLEQDGCFQVHQLVKPPTHVNSNNQSHIRVPTLNLLALYST